MSGKIKSLADISGCDSNCVCYDKQGNKIDLSQNQLDALCSLPFVEKFDCGQCKYNNNFWIMIGIIAGIIVISIIAAVIIGYRKRSRK